MPRLLLVEDDPITRDLMELALLRVPDVSFASAGSVEAARILLAGGETIDALITDLHLPGEDGLALVRSLRAMPARRHLPVIVTTSSRDPEDRLQAEAMGVRAFIEKPWSAATLREAVHSLFNGT